MLMMLEHLDSDEEGLVSLLMYEIVQFHFIRRMSLMFRDSFITNDEKQLQKAP